MREEVSQPSAGKVQPPLVNAEYCFACNLLTTPNERVVVKGKKIHNRQPCRQKLEQMVKFENAQKLSGWYG
jgi:hypothetical protein